MFREPRVSAHLWLPGPSLLWGPGISDHRLLTLEVGTLCSPGTAQTGRVTARLHIPTSSQSGKAQRQACWLLEHTQSPAPGPTRPLPGPVASSTSFPDPKGPPLAPQELWRLGPQTPLPTAPRQPRALGPPRPGLDIPRGQGWTSPGPLGQVQRRPLSLGRAFLPGAGLCHPLWAECQG